MVYLEGQDHGPSSSSVGDNDDDFIVYSKEGNNARWFNKVGDEVSAEDILCEVETVNATTLEDEDDIAKFKDYKPSQLGYSKEAKVPSDPSPPTPPKKEDRALSVPLSKIKGTGSDGTIVQADIEDYLGTSILLLSSSIVLLTDVLSIVHSHIPSCITSSGKGVSAPPTSKPKDKATEAGINYTDLPISQIRKAAALALCKVPQCNSSWTDEYIRQYHSVNVAVQTEHGLFVPVVRKGLSKIVDEDKSFTQKAKENSLKPEEYEGGTFTVSNLGGTYGIKQFCAIINPPQSGILAVGSGN
ncbi:hypothetical protein Sjap_017925 [Stephania japonica]|uniref:2-oxoacid dehydrogenase acyltransferase catalytic domain-containing protein n=1 Tax=Stephania japonica TaxID=461633 RepID=A0AAP0I733_9MAGN